MNMADKRKQRWAIRLMLWQLPVMGLIGCNIIPFSEPWTNWNFLGLACQAGLLFYAYSWINRSEDWLMRWISGYNSRKIPLRTYIIWSVIIIGFFIRFFSN
jgi:hypothetical protein